MEATTANMKATEPALGAGSTVWQQLAAFTETLLLAVWLGSMIFFSFAVAPSAFAVFPNDHELAGRIVTSAIGKVEMLGLVIGPLLVLIQAVTWQTRRASNSVKTVQLVLILIMTTAAALSRFWISAQMVSLRVSMIRIDDVPMTDPRRVEFNSLHGYSVVLMGAAMLAGLIVLFLTVRSWLKR
ncbi:MAG TPA: DUF4149 domain-containing protein [Blastocatellia bacterium]|nr:DUF4149 domain-containing protein [Blastocatellia bacterium]